MSDAGSLVQPHPRIGISRCLLGEPVRYEGGHRREAWLADVLAPRVEVGALCPEAEAGLGTPANRCIWHAGRAVGCV